VMERVLGPYLRGGGAKAFNFQVRLLTAPASVTLLAHKLMLPCYMVTLNCLLVTTLTKVLCVVC
jgi:hypothetical protein